MYNFLLYLKDITYTEVKGKMWLIHIYEIRLLGFRDILQIGDD